MNLSKRLLIIILKKVIRGVTLLLTLSILTFILMKNSPVDPVMASVNYDTSITQEQYKAIAEYWGLNKPITTQYIIWLKNFLSGDLGRSIIYRKPVGEIISQRFSASFLLMGASWILSGLLGFGLGVLAAFKRDKILDKVINWFSYIQASIPTFWLGLLMLLLFSVKLGWFPIGISRPIGMLSSDVTFMDSLRHLILPLLTLSVIGTAKVTLHTREKMIDVLSSEYVLFAKARGETNWQIFKNHALRNGVIPAITLHFSHFGELFAGSVLAERIFSYPGLGVALTEAGLKSDTSLLLAIVIIGAVFVFAGNLIADILNTITDPYLRWAS